MKRKKKDKTVKLSFIDRTLKNERITLAGKRIIISEYVNLTETFNKFFGNAA